jgi:hypothetical protein
LRDVLKSEKELKEQDEIEDEDHTRPKNRDEIKRMIFSLYTEQYELIQDSIIRAKRFIDTSSDSHALYNICLAYVTDIALQTDPRDNLGSWLKKIESLAKIKLVAIDSSTEEVLYGKELIE